jgi:two-component system response regulator AlgR
VALVDIRMPKMDGIELAGICRLEVAAGGDFVTAFDAYAVQAFELNAVDYLLKPVRAQRLLRRCRRFDKAVR